MNNAQQKAWIIFFKTFGGAAVRNVKPSSISDHQVLLAEQVVKALLRAYEGQGRIRNLGGLINRYVRPDFGVVKNLVRGEVEGQWRSWVISSSNTLPFNDKEFQAWMDHPSYTRGLALRNFLPAAISDGLSDSDFPAGFDISAARQNLEVDFKAGGAIFLDMLNPFQ